MSRMVWVWISPRVLKGGKPVLRDRRRALARVKVNFCSISKRGMVGWLGSGGRRCVWHLLVLLKCRGGEVYEEEGTGLKRLSYCEDPVALKETRSIGGDFIAHGDTRMPSVPTHAGCRIRV